MALPDQPVNVAHKWFVLCWRTESVNFFPRSHQRRPTIHRGSTRERYNRVAASARVSKPCKARLTESPPPEGEPVARSPSIPNTPLDRSGSDALDVGCPDGGRFVGVIGRPSLTLGYLRRMAAFELLIGQVLIGARIFRAHTLRQCLPCHRCPLSERSRAAGTRKRRRSPRYPESRSQVFSGFS